LVCCATVAHNGWFPVFESALMAMDDGPVIATPIRKSAPVVSMVLLATNDVPLLSTTMVDAATKENVAARAILGANSPTPRAPSISRREGCRDEPDLSKVFRIL
jgi:hypothetical protein